jgi:hypothetical protein
MPARPVILELLGDGVPRSQAAIIAALADRHSRDEVRCTLMRLAVTGQLVEQGGRLGPSPSDRTDQG